VYAADEHLHRRVHALVVRRHCGGVHQQIRLMAYEVPFLPLVYHDEARPLCRWLGTQPVHMDAGGARWSEPLDLPDGRIFATWLTPMRSASEVCVIDSTPD
jgi:hypothetical protein